MDDRSELWEVVLTAKTSKAQRLLPATVRDQLARLLKEIEFSGPIRRNWKNFSALSDSTYHCHLKKGRPTYVACWRVEDKKIKLIEVYYVGTHEGAPY
jgi:hypothetical protein